LTYEMFNVFIFYLLINLYMFRVTLYYLYFIKWY